MQTLRWFVSFVVLWGLSTSAVVLVAWLWLGLAGAQPDALSYGSWGLLGAALIGAVLLLVWAAFAASRVVRSLKATPLDRRIFSAPASIRPFVFQHPGNIVLCVGSPLGRRRVCISQGHLRGLSQRDLELLWAKLERAPSPLHLTIVTCLAPFSHRIWNALPEMDRLTPWAALKLLLLSPSWRLVLWLAQCPTEASHLWKSRATRSLAVIPGWAPIQVN